MVVRLPCERRSSSLQQSNFIEAITAPSSTKSAWRCHCAFHIGIEGVDKSIFDEAEGRACFRSLLAWTVLPSVYICLLA